MLRTNKMPLHSSEESELIRLSEDLQSSRTKQTIKGDKHYFIIGELRHIYFSSITSIESLALYGGEARIVSLQILISIL
jgi:hypothetical protein